MSVIPRPRRHARPLADFVAPTLGQALARQGFTGADIIGAWAEIVGDRLAEASQPMRIEWPRKPHGFDGPAREPATLVIRVESAFALELQHVAPIVTERINAYYGWRCVGRLVLKQGPVPRVPRPAPRPETLDAETAGRLAGEVDGIGDQALRHALDRLGRAVLVEAGGRPAGGTVPPQSPA